MPNLYAGLMQVNLRVRPSTHRQLKGLAIMEGISVSAKLKQLLEIAITADTLPAGPELIGAKKETKTVNVKMYVTEDMYAQIKEQSKIRGIPLIDMAERALLIGQ